MHSLVLLFKSQICDTTQSRPKCRIKNIIPKKGNAMIAFSLRRKAFFDHSHCSVIPLFLSQYQVIVGDGGVHSVYVYGGELVVAGIA